MFSDEILPLSWFEDRRITIMGLGLFGGGQGATEFFCRRGARVTVTDRRREDELRPALDALRSYPIRFVLGRHREKDFLEADLVVPSPAVPRDAPLLRMTEKAGVRLDTEMNLFFKYCPGRICAVTGSNGKSTTTQLLGTMAAQRWPRALVGGNIGRSLLPAVEEIRADDWVVLELSSFQLEDLSVLSKRPRLSIVTNLSPNHLDRHRTYENYTRAKKTILDPASGDDPGVAILNGDDPLTRSWAEGCPRRVVFFGRSARVRPSAPGIWLEESQGEVVDGRGSVPERLFASGDLRLIGRFNLLNGAAAAAAALEMGVSPPHVRQAIREFRGLEHRLELVGTLGGVKYINDSISTTPESTIAALEALRGDVILLCGGARKGVGFQNLAAAISRHAASVILLGTTAAEIERDVRGSRRPPPFVRVADVADAVDAAVRQARPGSCVLFSPACPSYDQFVNFAQRGRRFKELVRARLDSS